MNVKDAVGLATNHIQDLFEHEDISNLGLEEVEYDVDMQQWVVTVGFSRPWDYSQNALAALGGHGKPDRSFKIVKVNDANGEVMEIKNRPVSE